MFRHELSQNLRIPSLDPGAAKSVQRLSARAVALIGECLSWPLASKLMFAVVMVVVASVVRATLFDDLQSQLVYVTLFPAVAIAAIVAGVHGGLVAAVLAAFLAHAAIAPETSSGDWIGLVAFCVSNLIVIGIAGALRQAVAQLADAEQVRLGREQLSQFVEQAPAAICMLDQDMRYISSSRRWRKQWKLPGYLVNQSLSERLPELAQRLEASHKRGMARHMSRVDDQSLALPDGSRQWVKWEVHPWHRTRDGIGGIIVFTEDVTAQKQTDGALRESKARLRAVVDSAADAIIVVDGTGTVQSANPAATAIFGYSRDEFAGQNLAALMLPEHDLARDGFAGNAVQSGLRKIVGIARQVQGRHRDGTAFPMDLSVAEWRAADGKSFFTATMRDITQRKRVEEELARSRRLAAVGHLAGGIAHDFNNLLSVIAGNIELAEPLIADEATRQLMRKAREAAEQGASFNQRLLSLSRKRDLAPVRLVLNSRISEMTELLRRTLGADVSLETHLEPELWPTRVDPGEIDSVMLNLAVNARDAMPSGRHPKSQPATSHLMARPCEDTRSLILAAMSSFQLPTVA